MREGKPFFRLLFTWNPNALNLLNPIFVASNIPRLVYLFGIKAVMVIKIINTNPKITWGSLSTSTIRTPKTTVVRLAI